MYLQYKYQINYFAIDRACIYATEKISYLIFNVLAVQVSRNIFILYFQPPPLIQVAEKNQLQ